MKKMTKKAISLLMTLMMTTLMLNACSHEKQETTALSVLGDVRVRTALSYTIDRNRINNVVYSGGRELAYALIPPGMYDSKGDFRNHGRNDYIPSDYEVACNEARELLKEAGFPDGRGFPEIEYIFNEGGTHQTIAEILKEDWKRELGIDIKLTPMQSSAFWEQRKNDSINVARAGYTADFNDPISILSVWKSNSESNDANYNSKAYDQYIDASFAAMGNPTERATALHHAEDTLLQDMPLAPILYFTQQYLQKNSLNGVVNTPLGFHFFWNTNNESINALLSSEPNTMDPSLNTDVSVSSYIYHLFEGLYKYDNDGKLVLGQAKNVENRNGTVVVTLRDDIYWSDGKPVLAEDFVYSWKRLLDPKTGSDFSYVSSEIIKGGNDVISGKVSADSLPIRVISEKTFEFEMPYNDIPYLAELLSFPVFSPLREDIVESNPDWATNSNTYVSNGRYIINNWTHDSELVIVKNDNYYDADSVKTQKIAFKFIDTDITAFTAFNNGELDLSTRFPTEETRNLQGKDEYHNKPLVGTYYILFNCIEVE
jgi:ABC-type oligopeptide transport system substrate-binding subunit